MLRFKKYSTFFQQYCKSKFNHPVIMVHDLCAKINKEDKKEKKMTVAWCAVCDYTWNTTHSRIKRLLKTHEYRG